MTEIGEYSVIDEKVDMFIDETNRKKWLIYPRNNLKTGWDIWILILMAYTATYFPYLICFYDSVGEK